MPRLKNSFAVLLLAFWLAATQHCGLEAAELFASHTDEAGCCKEAKACVGDNCEFVESGAYQLSNASVNAPLPAVFLLCTGLLCPQPDALFVLDVQLTPETTARPLNWVPTWSFVRREAPAPRAPASLA